MCSSQTVLCVMFATCLGQGEAGFLRRGSAPTAHRVSQGELQSDLLQEVQNAFGGGRRFSKIAHIEDTLRSMYQVLEKNNQGYLGHAAVRFALHRYFVQRHGWFVKGFESGEVSSDQSAPSDVLEDKVPSFIQNLFEHRLGSRGLDLRELAVLAATLEHLAHDEAVARLQGVYQATNLPFHEGSNETDVANAIESYMMLYILGEVAENVNLRNVKSLIHKMYPTWSDTQDFLTDVRNNVAFADRNNKNPFVQHLSTFDDVLNVVEEVGDRYGRFQDGECVSMKEALVAMEDRGSGRVRLSNFYHSAAGGSWQFTESIEALRDVGALDESDPANLRVIVPNYIASPSNCLASASFYTTCCMDECEPILGQIESKIGAPRATPNEILSVVSDVDSPTVDAPRNLSDALTRRLAEVAKVHDGRVPLHGRLFAQWLHHAFPRECPYPRAPGSRSSRSRMDWMENHQDVLVSEEQMNLHAQNASNSSMSFDDVQADTDEADLMPWNNEELLVVQSMTDRKGIGSTIWAIGRCVAFLSVLASAGLSLVRTVSPMLAVVSSGDCIPKEHLV